MIYDRPYMQDDYQPKQSPVLKWIIVSTIAVFVLQNVLGTWFRSDAIREFFALSTGALGMGLVWTLVTYAFLHASLFHILGNMLVVFFIGRELLPLLGARRFTQLYFAAAAVGGILWLLVGLASPSHGLLVGASGSALGLLTVFACIYPNKPITLLLFFVIPVTIKPKYIIYGMLAFSLFGLLFLELPPGGDNIAHSAHLGGMLTGWLFFQYTHARPAKPRAQTGIEPPSWFKKKTVPKESGNFSVNITNRKVLQQEVDRILDKINSRGFGALTDEEKRLLDRAKDLLNK